MVNQKKCIGCGTCIEICPVNAISFADNGKAVINPDICIKCGACEAVCPVACIEIKR